jgi:large subunit ribosomal protein L21
MTAIIVTGGKQYKVAEGDTLFIEKLPVEPGDTVKFDKVLLIADNGEIKAGTPYVDGATVEATLEKNGKGKKIRIFKYKAKKTYRKRIGHRQPYSKVVITAVNA